MSEANEQDLIEIIEIMRAKKSVLDLEKIAAQKKKIISDAEKLFWSKKTILIYRVVFLFLIIKYQNFECKNALYTLYEVYSYF